MIFTCNSAVSNGFLLVSSIVETIDLKLMLKRQIKA